MGLTLRQRAFLSKLVDLYREAQQPVHYSVLARTLGVSRFSAYDMLKLLESKGMVRSEYVREQSGGSPGRSSVVFAPLARAREVLSRLVSSSNPVEQREWTQTVEHILGRLQEAEERHLPGNTPADAASQRASDAGLLDELLANIPKATSPLAYSAQVLTALLLPVRSRLRSLDRDLAAMLNLDEQGAEAGGGLDLLAGFALGCSLAATTSRVRRDISVRLMDYSRTCQSYISQMDAERRRILADFVREVVTSLEHQSNKLSG